MKPFLLITACALIFWSCDKEPRDACMPPGPTPVYLLLKDSSGRNLLNPPARYAKDSIRIRYGSEAFAAAKTDTVGTDRALVVYVLTPSDCGGTDRKTGPWTRIAIQLDAATTDSLAVDRSPDYRFEYRYNGRIQTPSAGYPQRTVIPIVRR